jgi:hypothetical protein
MSRNAAAYDLLAAYVALDAAASGHGSAEEAEAGAVPFLTDVFGYTAHSLALATGAPSDVTEAAARFEQRVNSILAAKAAVNATGRAVATVANISSLIGFELADPLNALIRDGGRTQVNQWQLLAANTVAQASHVSVSMPLASTFTAGTNPIATPLAATPTSNANGNWVEPLYISAKARRALMVWNLHHHLLDYTHWLFLGAGGTATCSST